MEGSYVEMLVAVALGVAFMVVGGRMYRSQVRLRRRCSVQTQGRVVAMKRIKRKTPRSGYNRDRNPDRATYAPVFAYVVAGRTIKAQADVSSHTRFEVGHVVTLFYNPDKVEEYCVPEDKT